MEIISPMAGVSIRGNALALRNFCDKVSTYTSQAKIKNFPYGIDVVQKMAAYRKELVDTEAIVKTAGELNQKVQYLTQAKQ